jgi:allophanate hydrolase subunit 1
VKVSLWQPKDEVVQAATAALVPAEEAVITTIVQATESVIVEPDVERVTQLRTELLESLTTSLRAGELKDREKIRILEILLQYENSLRASMAPNIRILNDNRRQTITVATTLAEELAARLSPDQLRLVAGVASPIDFVEGVVTPIGDNSNVQDE